MIETYGSQQSDEWMKQRVGRITASGMADCIAYLKRASNGKKAGESSKVRDNYKMKLIAERLTGRMANNFTSPEMEWGIQYEGEARQCYEMATKTLVEPVNLVVHPRHDFIAASPDGLIDEDGVLEIKCPNTTTHLGYMVEDVMPDDYVPQVATQLLCSGRNYVDFVSYDPRIEDSRGRFFYRRTTVEELRLEIYDGSVLEGKDVLDYIEAQAVLMNLEIEAFFARRGLTPVAPFELRVKEEDHERNRVESCD